MSRTPVAPSRSRLRPLGLDEVQITGGDWASRQEVNADATLAHCQGWMERLGWLANFTRAVDGTIAGNHQGMVFADSDVFKLMEAMAWEVGRSGSEDADARFRHLTSVVAPAQEGDGYLNTVFGRDGQRPRYSDLEWGHELYNDGHLFQAAVAAPARPDPTSWSPRRGASPTTCATRSATAASNGSAATPKSSSAWPSWPASRVSSATSIRRPVSSNGAAGAHSARSSSARRTSRTTCRSVTPPSSAATPCAPCTSPPARSTSPSRRVTTNCSGP